MHPHYVTLPLILAYLVNQSFFSRYVEEHVVLMQATLYFLQKTKIACRLKAVNILD